MKGLHCNIYKTKGHDCSNGGLSHKADAATLLGIINGDGPLMPCADLWEPDDEHPAVIIRERTELRGCIGFERGKIFTAYPANKDGKCIDGMFGGSFVYCSDARFPFDCPIALHDRHE